MTAFVDGPPRSRRRWTAAGLDPARVRASVAALGDRSCGRSRRAWRRSRAIPVAGAAFTGKQVGLVAGLILIIVFVIIIA